MAEQEQQSKWDQDQAAREAYLHNQFGINLRLAVSELSDEDQFCLEMAHLSL